MPTTTNIQDNTQEILTAIAIEALYTNDYIIKEIINYDPNAEAAELAEIQQTNGRGGFNSYQAHAALSYIFNAYPEIYIPTIDEMANQIDVESLYNNGRRNIAFLFATYRTIHDSVTQAKTRDGHHLAIWVTLTKIQNAINVNIEYTTFINQFTHRDINAERNLIDPTEKKRLTQLFARCNKVTCVHTSTPFGSQTDNWSCCVHGIATLHKRVLEDFPVYSFTPPTLDVKALSKKYYRAYKAGEGNYQLAHRNFKQIEITNTDELIKALKQLNQLDKKNALLLNHMHLLNRTNIESILLCLKQTERSNIFPQYKHLIDSTNLTEILNCFEPTNRLQLLLLYQHCLDEKNITSIIKCFETTKRQETIEKLILSSNNKGVPTKWLQSALTLFSSPQDTYWSIFKNCIPHLSKEAIIGWLDIQPHFNDRLKLLTLYKTCQSAKDFLFTQLDVLQHTVPDVAKLTQAELIDVFSVFGPDNWKLVMKYYIQGQNPFNDTKSIYNFLTELMKKNKDTSADYSMLVRLIMASNKKITRSTLKDDLFSFSIPDTLVPIIAMTTGQEFKYSCSQTQKLLADYLGVSKVEIRQVNPAWNTQDEKIITLFITPSAQHSINQLNSQIGNLSKKIKKPAEAFHLKNMPPPNGLLKTPCYQLTLRGSLTSLLEELNQHHTKVTQQTPNLPRKPGFVALA